MNILIIRFSALGDVILTIPVVNTLVESYPNLNVWICSDFKNKTLFDFSERVHFIGADLKGKHSNIQKLISFINETHSSIKFDVVYDLHDVIRSKIIRFNFSIKGVKTRKFNKGRNEKKRLIAKKIDFQKLKHTTTRYLETFKKDFDKLNMTYCYHPLLKSRNNLSPSSNSIGIAPFAAHSSKEWPLENFIPIIKCFPEFKFIFFAFGKREISLVNQLFIGFKNYSIVEGSLNFEEQIQLINGLNAMIVMDSANMHLASLTYTDVISIWGPTHHYTGFGPLNNEQNIVEIPQSELKCRPCSIYGKINNKSKTCAQKSMSKIKPEMVIKKLNEIIN